MGRPYSRLPPIFVRQRFRAASGEVVLGMVLVGAGMVGLTALGNVDTSVGTAGAVLRPH